MSESATSARKVRGKERTAQAVELRKAGLTYEQIAKQLGYDSVQGAHIAVTRALKRLDERIAEEIPELRRLEIERLDRMLVAIWPQVIQGNYGAIDRALRIMERRAKLCGLDAPTRQDITTAGQPLFDVEEWRQKVEQNAEQMEEATDG